VKPGSLRPFACPDLPGTDLWAEAIDLAHAKASVWTLIDRERDTIERRSRGLIELLDAWLLGTTDFETTWDLCFGRVFRALETEEVDATGALAEAAFRLTSRGVPGSYSAALGKDRRLVYDREWLLPRACELSVESDGDRVLVEGKSGDGRVFDAAFDRDGDSWIAHGAEQLLRAGKRRPITLFSSDGVPDDMIVEDDFHSIFEFPPVTPEIAAAFSSALALIEHHAPSYFTWVDRVLRGVLACRCHASRTRSSSWMHAPGIILVSCSDNPIELAEMLVHECSHQHYYLVSRIGPVVNGAGDSREYYSPAVQRMRPLGKLLVGYHAFANVLLFYRTLLENGLAGNAYCVSLEARLTSEVEELEAPLRDNPVLTDIGRDLSSPLMERLHGSRPAEAAR
jgi:hypothetical protein